MINDEYCLLLYVFLDIFSLFKTLVREFSKEIQIFTVKVVSLLRILHSKDATFELFFMIERIFSESYQNMSPVIFLCKSSR